MQIPGQGASLRQGDRRYLELNVTIGRFFGRQDATELMPAAWHQEMQVEVGPRRERVVT